MLCSTLWKNSGQLFAISIFESIRFVFRTNPYTWTNDNDIKKDVRVFFS